MDKNNGVMEAINVPEEIQEEIRKFSQTTINIVLG